VSYREHAAPDRWRGLVECGWTSAAPGAAYIQDVLPDGCMDLVWSGTGLLVAGPDTAPRPVLRAARHAAAGLRFAPGVLPSLLAVPASALRDERVPLATLHGHLGREAAARLGELTASAAHPVAAGDPAPTGDPWPVAALRVLADVAARLPGAAPEPRVRAAAGRLAAGASAAATADALGWTTRSLHRRCLVAFGYGPAVLRRVLRFRRASALLAAGVPIAEVAARAGYADQPHLSREVRALAGVAPTSLGPSGTWLPSGMRKRGEQVHAVAVRVVHDGVALPPERVERRQLAVVARGDHGLVRGVHPGGVRQP
jgi:AraC-like DNA-binding protein